MNRKARRIAAKRDLARRSAPSDTIGVPRTVVDLMDKARQSYRQGHGAQAESLCRQVLALMPAHVDSLNLMGIIARSSGRHKLSVKMLSRAIASDPINAACHYNLGSSYQAVNQHENAATHFKKAIALGLSGNNTEEFITRNPTIATYLDRLEKEQLLLHQTDFFDASGLESIANDLFLRCAMECVVLRGRVLEMLLTRLRFAFLRFATANAAAPRPVSDDLVSCLSALALQCFLNEYVYFQTPDETQHSIRLRNLLLEQLNSGCESEPITLAAVAAYFPLYQLPGADKILKREWPKTIGELITQQLYQPLEELRGASAISALTAIDQGISLQVMRQYEQNPYPRWSLDSQAAALTEEGAQQADVGVEILVAGCGTGRHALQVARQYPKAQILAIDLSVPSLAYARRKTLEAGFNNVAYAQADILKLQAIRRHFDRIEVVGVLHHLADPETGWRILLSLLRPGGEMRVGLYSEAARRGIVEARALIKQRGYRPTRDDIRKCREDIFNSDGDGRWRRITSNADFYSVSGCRDLLFNVMEHQFTIPRISKFLDENKISFLGFEEPQVIQLFQRQFPEAALTDLQQWHEFEKANPMAFRHMYVFSVCKQTHA